VAALQAELGLVEKERAAEAADYNAACAENAKLREALGAADEELTKAIEAEDFDETIVRINGLRNYIRAALKKEKKEEEL